MNILAVDVLGMLSQAQIEFCKNRLRRSLAEFSHQIEGVTILFSKGSVDGMILCRINVNTTEFGVVSSNRISRSFRGVVNGAINAVEMQIADHLSDRICINR